MLLRLPLPAITARLQHTHLSGLHACIAAAQHAAAAAAEDAA
jgi:hypothetical protein